MAGFTLLAPASRIPFDRTHYRSWMRTSVTLCHVYLSTAMQLLLQNDIYRVQDDIDDTKALLDLARAAQVSSGFRDWLEAPDATIGFNKAGKKKHPGTGLRLVKVPAFTTWLGSLLLFSGLSASQDAARVCYALQPFNSRFGSAGQTHVLA
ncbi:hypothetical protein IWW34DRAFT_902494 [Fusarium oxysporum f. sp. albedinis]|nr:hypothetical protein IWW34DRAFT_902494 [Fusarium oxysporum f. sp. albedinis]